MGRSFQGQNHGKEGIAGSPTIYWLPLKMSFDNEKPDHTESV